MADTLRDLVVKLSLDSNQFATNIKHINAQIAETKSQFELAKSGVDGFEKSASNTAAQISMLQETLSLQKTLIEQYEKSLAATEDRLANTMARHQQLEQAYASSAAAVAAATANHNALAQALREEQQNGGDAKKIADLTAQLAASKEAVTGLREQHSAYGVQLRANENSQQRLADQITRTNTNINSSKASYADMAAALATITNTLTPAEQAWKNFSDTSQFAQTLIGSFSASIRQAGADFQLFAASSGEAPNSVAMMTAKMTELKSVAESQKNIVASAAEAYKAASGQMDLLSQSAGATVEQWFAQNAAVQSAKLALTEAETALAKTQNEITSLNAKLSEHGQAMSALSESERMFGMMAQENSAGIQTLASQFSLFAATTSAVPGSIEYLKTQLDNLNSTYELQSRNVETLRQASDVAAEKFRLMGDAGTYSASEMSKQSIAMQQASQAYNKASSDLAKTAKEIERIKAALSPAEQAWKAQSKAVEQNEKSINAYVNSMKMVKAENENAKSELGNHATALETAKQKQEALTKEYEKSVEGLRLYAQAVADAKTLLDQANASGDPSKIAEASQKYNDAQVAMLNAGSACNKLKSDLADANNEVDRASNVWLNAATSMEEFGNKTEEVGKNLYNNVTKPIAQFASDSEQVFMTMEMSEAKLRQVTNATEEQYASVTDAARDMSEQLGVSASSIIGVMTEVGRLGVDIEGDGKDFVAFTETVERMSLTLGVSATDCATSVARFFNLMGNSTSEITNYGASVTYLANNYATTADEIIQMSQGLAGAGKTVGMSAQDILGVSTALTSVGITAGRGATTFSQALIKMETSVQTGDKYLEDFAKVAGMTSEEFVAAWKDNPTEAFTAFILGLASMDDATASSIAALQECGIKTARLTDSLLRITSNTENFTNAIRDANAAWDDTAILSGTSDKVIGTLQTRLNALKESFRNLKETIGKDLSPVFSKLLSIGKSVVDWFANLSGPVRTVIEVIGGLAAAIGPALMAIGFISTYIGKAIPLFASLVTGVKTAITSMVGFVASMGPVGIALTAIAAAAAIAYAAINTYSQSAVSARVTQEALNKAVEQWEQDVRTAFETARGLAGFGLSGDDFTPTSDGGTGWLESTIQTWTDGKAETDKIVNETVEAFTSGTDRIRAAINSAMSSPDANLIDISSDMTRLDEIDARIEEIIRKRQNGKLTQTDVDELQSLVDERGAIEIKYNLVPETADTDTGFGSIKEKAEAAMARNANASDVYNDVFSSAVQGLGSYIENLNAAYDAEYLAAQGMEDADARIEALGKWYNDAATNGIAEYVRLMQWANESLGMFGENGQFGQTASQLEHIYDLMEKAKGKDAGSPEVQELATALQGLDETSIVELDAALGAAKTSGMAFTEEMTRCSDALENVKTLANDPALLFGGDVDKTLSSMFGDALTGETVEVFATLNCDGLASAYKAWAEGDHEPIIPVIDPIDASSVAIIGTVSVEGTVVSVSAPEGGTITLSDEWRVGVGGVLTHVDPKTGEEYLTEFIVDVNGQLNKVDPKTGETYKVDSAEVNVDGQLVSLTSGETRFSISVDGELGTVNVTESTVLPVVEVEAKVTKVDFDYGDGFTNTSDPSTAFDVASSWKTSPTWTDWTGTGFDEAMTRMSKFTETAQKMGVGYSETMALMNGGKSDKELLSESLNAEDGKGFMETAQYFTSGFELLANGQMDQSKMEEFMANYKILSDFLTNYGSEVDPGTGKTFASVFSDYFGNFGWEVDSTNITDAFTSAMEAAQGQLTNLGSDMAAGVGAGQITHDFSPEASTTISNDVTALSTAAEQGSPCGITKPLGNDVAAGIGVGMTEFDFSADAATVAANLMGSVSSSLTSSGGGANTAATEALSGIQNALTSTDTNTSSVGKNLMDGIKSGIEEGRSGVVTAACDAVREAIRSAKAEAEIHSPSRVMRDEVGVMLMRGMGIGIDQESMKTAKRMANATRYVMGASSGTAGSTYNNQRTYNQNSNLTLNIDGLAVRDDNDVRSLAIELSDLTKRNNRLMGVLA